MCLYTNRQRCRDFVKKNKGKTWLYVYKLVKVKKVYTYYDYKVIREELHSPFQSYINKIGLNYTCEKYTPKFNRHTEVDTGFHFFLTRKKALENAHGSHEIIRCQVFMKDFIAAGVWEHFEISDKNIENYQAVFGSYYISEHQYNKVLK